MTVTALRLTETTTTPTVQVAVCGNPKCDNPIPRGRRSYCCDACGKAARRAYRVRESDEYAQMTARMVRAFGRRAAQDADGLAYLVAMQAEIDSALRTAVMGLRNQAVPMSWAEIGDLLGITRQAAQQRWGKK